MSKKKKIFLIVYITILLMLVDQTMKYVVQTQDYNEIYFGIVEIKLTKNQGVAFSLNNGNIKNIIITSIVLALIINFIVKQINKFDKNTIYSVSFVLAGGITNLIDRIFKGGVVDFIKVKNFSVFNLADCYIVLGWILFVVFFIIFNNKKDLGEKNCEKQ